MFDEFIYNFQHNLFKPLLLFFYAGFAIPLLKVPFEFPKALYQSLTLYLLVAIGWHGGEELASLTSTGLHQALGFIVIGFCLNFAIGCLAYWILRKATRLRHVDAATVAGYYGSDSAGTFVTCVGVLATLNIAYAAYMPVMLAVMEIPGCLVALYLVSRLRHHGMDAAGNMPDEEDYGKVSRVAPSRPGHNSEHTYVEEVEEMEEWQGEHNHPAGTVAVRRRAKVAKATGPVTRAAHDVQPTKSNWILLHEVLFNPGLYLLFAGIVIGYISRLQGVKVTKDDDLLFVSLFQGVLCLFLLEMGITACNRLRDLKRAGARFIAFGLIAPNVFATIGILVAHLYSTFLGTPFELGTYTLFAVLCGAASYIAVPAVQRLAIPEASPTLPLAASLGLTFSYNVTVGIPVYIEIAKGIAHAWPVAAAG